jgi:hypothetical protein
MKLLFYVISMIDFSMKTSLYNGAFLNQGLVLNGKQLCSLSGTRCNGGQHSCKTPWISSPQQKYTDGATTAVGKLVPTFAGDGCRAVSATDLHGRYTLFSRREPFLNNLHEAQWTPFQTHFLLRKYYIAGNRTEASGSVVRRLVNRSHGRYRCTEIQNALGPSGGSTFNSTLPICCDALREAKVYYVRMPEIGTLHKEVGCLHITLDSDLNFTAECTACI